MSRFIFFAMLLSELPVLGQLSEYGMLYSGVSECSGLDVVWNNLYAHNDSGDTNCVYKLSMTGELEEQIFLSSLTNIDWEDISCDPSGTYFFIGDFGSNNFLFERPERILYKVPTGVNGSGTKSQIIHFEFDGYVASSQHETFDCEALCVLGEEILLFTKNHGTSGYSRVYSLNKTDTIQTAKLIDSVYTNFKVTGADSFLDEIVLLTEGSVVRGKLVDDRFFVDQTYDLPYAKYEAITYKDINHLLIAKDSEGLLLFQMELRDENNLYWDVFIQGGEKVIVAPKHELLDELRQISIYTCEGKLLLEQGLDTCCQYYEFTLPKHTPQIIIIQLKTSSKALTYKRALF